MTISEQPQRAQEGSTARRRITRIPRAIPTIRRPSAAPKTRRPGLVYLKHALMHPWHLLVLAMATVSGVLFWSVLVPIVVIVGSELLVLAIAPQMAAFRRYVDARLDQGERLVASEARAGLLAKMEKEHRQELERLEVLVDRIRERVRPQGSDPECGDDWLGLGRLTACYVPLAIAYRTSKECLASTDREGLEEEIRVLRASRRGASERTRALSHQRLAVAERRADQWDRSRADLEAMAEQLALISELIHLTHEQCAAPFDPEGATEEISRARATLDENEGTLRELAELFVADEAIDPRVLELGRDRPVPPKPPRPRVVWPPPDGGPSMLALLEGAAPRPRESDDYEAARTLPPLPIV